jgi:methyl-accepting chemotaxis protein
MSRPVDPLIAELESIDRLISGTSTQAERASEQLADAINDLKLASEQLVSSMIDLTDRVVELEGEVTTLTEERDELRGRLDIWFAGQGEIS